jgi:hypothetical protein
MTTTTTTATTTTNHHNYNYNHLIGAQDAGGKKESIRLGCSLAQMQDLVSKLKDASKRLEVLSTNS